MKNAAVKIALAMAFGIAVVAVQPASADRPGSGSTQHEVGSEGLPLAEGMPVPDIASGFPGIRPGILMTSPNGCTLNFIFNSTGKLGSGPYYVGTARHCVQRQKQATEGSGYDTSENVIGKPILAVIARRAGEIPRVTKIGAVAYAEPGGAEIANDFALIRIGGNCTSSSGSVSCDSSLDSLVSPSVIEVGGPTSPSGGALNDAILAIGHGLVIGTISQARPGVLSALNAAFPNGYGALIAAAPGDSGAPVMTVSGAAVGNLTEVGPGLPLPANPIVQLWNRNFAPATAFGTRVSYVNSKWGLTVVTCSSASPWGETGCPR